MNKNKKFQKEQLAKEGYTEFKEFYKEILKRLKQNHLSRNARMQIIHGRINEQDIITAIHAGMYRTGVQRQTWARSVTLMGWVQKSRNKGGIIFTDLRDRSGIIQIIFEESDCGAESFAKAERLRSEFAIAVTGVVEKRSGAANENLKDRCHRGAGKIPADPFRIRGSAVPH